MPIVFPVNQNKLTHARCEVEIFKNISKPNCNYRISKIIHPVFKNNFWKQLLSSSRYKENIKLWTGYIDNILISWEGSIQEVQLFVNEVINKDKNLWFKEGLGGKKINYLNLNIQIKDNGSCLLYTSRCV